MLGRRIVSAQQCRAARALLHWSQNDLAARAGVARKTVVEFEHESRRLQARTRHAITRALEDAGVVFEWDEAGLATAVRLRPTS